MKIDTDALLESARNWVAQDTDPETLAELASLIAAAQTRSEPAAEHELRNRFDGRLQFGTAGLRGELGAGPTRMNRVVVAQTAAGLASYLSATTDSPSIVIGYDARKNSRIFAQDTAEIMAGSGIATILLPRELPTPVLAFAVRRLGMGAGVMVTASHNPASDNGYKVYLGGVDDGAQIVAPQDSDIAHAIERAARIPIAQYPRSATYAIADDSIVADYIRASAGIGMPGNTHLRVVYTALHGVGWQTARDTFVRAGFGEPISVAAQQDPDPTFPTVAFPNPEEPGALDLAFVTADAAGADVIIANDPDADRLAVAIPSADGWRRLTGNEVGMLLGWRAAEKHVAGLTAISNANTLAASLVSSPGLARIAAEFGLDYVDTLTGFKYISRVPRLLFGFEEALGYLVDPAKVHDKDGISAAVEFLSLAGDLHDQGVSIEQRLQHMAEEFGGHASEQVSIRVTSLTEIIGIMARLRSDPPRSIGSDAISGSDDFAAGVAGFPLDDILRYRLVSGARVIIRPSGTEPKLKAYIDVCNETGDGEERLTRARAQAALLAAEVTTLLTLE